MGASPWRFKSSSAHSASRQNLYLDASQNKPAKQNYLRSQMGKHFGGVDHDTLI